ncbi:GNAT family N-acetyltransferase [Virgibacillus sp. MSJ-26]|uniref:GNAT family N-acetyltransferase n=1 Tax=Virgibacillus sp. MSJ-26 TaxID=2841522 RepID=UPI001C0F9F4F|nr:GNAT family N-acetyltransferase [Virgibacillus sp. MSJ-26]
MSEIPLYMKHDLKNIPHFSLPAGYHFRLFSREEDANLWAKTVTKTDEFSNEENAIKRFNEEFLPHVSEVEKRVVFIETSDGNIAGTATAWFGTWGGQDIGRLHWVEIIPEHQGKKLGRPLITKAMAILSDYHSSAYLKTQESSQAAIHLYQKLGWEPVVRLEQEEQIWEGLK